MTETIPDKLRRAHDLLEEAASIIDDVQLDFPRAGLPQAKQQAGGAIAWLGIALGPSNRRK